MLSRQVKARIRLNKFRKMFIGPIERAEWKEYNRVVNNLPRPEHRGVSPLAAIRGLRQPLFEIHVPEEGPTHWYEDLFAAPETTLP